MPTLHVCSLDRVEAVLASARPTAAVSLIRPPPGVDMPRGLARLGPDWLHLRFDDVEEPGPDAIMPDVDAIATLVGFLQSRGGNGPILLHCFMGVGRSAAAALILLALSAPGQERRQAERLHAAMPFARPNRPMLSIADRLLGRDGRLADAAAIFLGAEPVTAARPVSLRHSWGG